MYKSSRITNLVCCFLITLASAGISNSTFSYTDIVIRNDYFQDIYLDEPMHMTKIAGMEDFYSINMLIDLNARIKKSEGVVQWNSNPYINIVKIKSCEEICISLANVSKGKYPEKFKIVLLFCSNNIENCKDYNDYVENLIQNGWISIFEYDKNETKNIFSINKSNTFKLTEKASEDFREFLNSSLN